MNLKLSMKQFFYILMLLNGQLFSSELPACDMLYDSKDTVESTQDIHAAMGHSMVEDDEAKSSWQEPCCEDCACVKATCHAYAFVMNDTNIYFENHLIKHFALSNSLKSKNHPSLPHRPPIV